MECQGVVAKQVGLQQQVEQHMWDLSGVIRVESRKAKQQNSSERQGY